MQKRVFGRTECTISSCCGTPPRRRRAIRSQPERDLIVRPRNLALRTFDALDLADLWR